MDILDTLTDEQRAEVERVYSKRPVDKNGEILNIGDEVIYHGDRDLLFDGDKVYITGFIENKFVGPMVQCHWANLYLNEIEKVPQDSLEKIFEDAAGGFGNTYLKQFPCLCFYTL